MRRRNYNINDSYRVTHSSISQYSSNYRQTRARRKRLSSLIICLVFLGVIVVSTFLLIGYFIKDDNGHEMFSIFEDKKKIYEKDNSDEVYYFYNQINDKEKEVYDEILEGILEYDKVIKVSSNSIEEIDKIKNMILADHPELFWFTGSCSTISYIDRIDLKMEYCFKENELEQRANEIEKKAQEFDNTLSESDTEYDIIRKAYLFVIDTVDYDLNASYNQTVYSSLVNNSSVCAGYSKAMQLLAQRNGVQALYVWGPADGINGWEDHAWNIIRCDGKYYQVDVTFADSYNKNKRIEELGVHNFNYLCIDDETMYRNHKISNSLMVPKCDSKELNYYVLNNLYSDTYGEYVISSMKRYVNKGKNVWRFQFSNYESYAECLEDIKKGKFSSILYEDLKVLTQTFYTCDEAMYSVMCWY